MPVLLGRGNAEWNQGVSETDKKCGWGFGWVVCIWIMIFRIASQTEQITELKNRISYLEAYAAARVAKENDDASKRSH